MTQAISAPRVAALVDGFDRSPAYLGLATALREVIGDGRIGYGTRLPSERELTASLGVSRTTVTRAYAELRDTGYAEARHGAGTFTQLPGGPVRAYDRALRPGEVSGIDLTCAAASAPPGIAAAYAEAAARMPAHLGSHGYYPAGLPALQAALAATYDERGLPTRPEQIIVTAGALAATATVGRALATGGARVLVDSPTYPNAVQAVRAGGGRTVTTPIEPDGWDLDQIASTLRRRRPVLAHVMPEFHNPTGLVMPEADRHRYAAELRRHGGVALVDEAHQALRLDEGTDAPPFATLAPDAITIGSASKSVWGGLRIGWIRSPAPLVDTLVQSRITLDLGAPVLEQLVMLHLLEDGFTQVLAEHTARLRTQRDALVAALGEHLPDWRFRVPEGGMALWCALPGSSRRLVDAAAAYDVHLAPGPAFAPAGGLDRYLRLTFTRPAEELTEAVRRLAAAWADTEGTAPPRRTTTDPVMVA
ncbi:PLP-dependent aminotransferase family protein [Nocardioides panacisoli]|uniref:MocR-like transcription factor YczR n=1 Tax=Nocardioides panacisoli TaxID=627624 RepID=UPI001C634B63|nr:PLP-dependent aminotransferase family protein [Nocardioides panacisoli]QYJ04476.1 PLP-dependent aminotransferase family protein [Nocardioides panacisoli]